MLLLKLGSQLPKLVKNLQSALKIWAKIRLNLHELEYLHEVKYARVRNVSFSENVAYTLNKWSHIGLLRYLMITHAEKWDYLAVSELSALLREG